MFLKTDFQVLIVVDRYRKANLGVRFAINVVTAVNSHQSPTSSLNDLCKLLSGDSQISYSDFDKSVCRSNREV
jgi:hypothetical protein